MNANPKPEFQELIAQIKAGSEDAVGVLMEHYADAINKVIRRRLNVRMRSQYDTADFSQIVWASFFADLDRLSGCKSSSDLQSLLTTMARNKVVDEYRARLERQQRDLKREQRIERGDSATNIPIESGEATPSYIVSMREQWDRLLQALPERHRKMIVLRASGFTFKEIAEKVDMNERTIRRVFNSIQQRMPRIRGTEADSTY